MVTSSGIAPSVMISRTKSKSVWLADGKADFDLLVAHAHQQVEHAALACRAHRVDQCLVAITQVDRAPQRCFVDDAIGPGAVGQPDRLDLVGE